MFNVRRIFEKIFTIVGVVFLFYHIVWLNIGRRFLSIIQQLYSDFWSFVGSDRLITVLFFLGATILVIIFLIPFIFSDYEEVEEEPGKKEGPL